MHALRDVTIKSTKDLERAFFYLGFRLPVLEKSDLEVFFKVKQELINRGVIPQEVK